MDITDRLPRPNFKNTKPKITERGELDLMERDLHKHIRTIKQEATMIEDAFTDSLRKVNGKTFIDSILPSLRRY